MKRIFAALFVWSLSCSPALATHEKDHHHETSKWLKIGVDAPFTLFGAYIAMGEFSLNEHMSLIARAGYIDTRNTVNSNVAQLPGWFAKMGAGARFNLFGHGLGGFFVEDLLDFDFGVTYSGVKVGNNGPGMFKLTNAMHLGYSWITDVGFFIDAMAGVATFVTWGIPNPPSFLQMNRFEGRVFVGWAF